MLHSPVIITSRLMPGVRLSGATISLDNGGSSISGAGRVCFRYFIDLDAGFAFEGNDLASGCFDSPSAKLIQSALCSLLGFLEAAGESYRFRMRLGRLASADVMFPAQVVEWAYQNSEELSVLSLQLAQIPGLIEEAA